MDLAKCTNNRKKSEDFLGFIQGFQSKYCKYCKFSKLRMDLNWQFEITNSLPPESENGTDGGEVRNKLEND